MPGIIGRKIGMTSVFNEAGKNMPCTVISAGPCVITQLRTEEIDGYTAVQIGYEEKAEKRSSAASHAISAALIEALKASTVGKTLVEENSAAHPRSATVDLALHIANAIHAVASALVFSNPRAIEATTRAELLLPPCP